MFHRRFLHGSKHPRTFASIRFCFSCVQKIFPGPLCVYSLFLWTEVPIFQDLWVCFPSDRQISSGQTIRQTDGQTNGLTHRTTGRLTDSCQTHSQTDGKPHRQTNKQADRLSDEFSSGVSSAFVFYTPSVWYVCCFVISRSPAFALCPMLACFIDGHRLVFFWLANQTTTIKICFPYCNILLPSIPLSLVVIS